MIASQLYSEKLQAPICREFPMKNGRKSEKTEIFG